MCNEQTNSKGKAADGQSKDGIELGEEDKDKPRESEWKVYLAPIGHEYYHNVRTGEQSLLSNCS